MSARMEVLIDGEWTAIPAEPVEFTPNPDPAIEETWPVETRQQWTLDLHTQGQAFGRSLHDVIVQAERRAFADRCARRMWLTHPYRMRGAH